MKIVKNKCHLLPIQWPSPSQSGFSLIEMALVLLVMGIMGAMFLPLTSTLMDHNKRQETKLKLDTVEQAIAQFVMVNRRLPCPADGRAHETNAAFGREGRNLAGQCTAMDWGVVPWASLGMTLKDATDAWGTLLSYRVWAATAAPATVVAVVGNGSLSKDNGMNTTECNGSNNTDAQLNCIAGTTSLENWLKTQDTAAPPAPPPPPAGRARGLRVCQRTAITQPTTCAVGAAPQEITSPTSGTGAAYLLISHGANQQWGYKPNISNPINAAGLFMANPIGPGGGTRETQNRNNLALRQHAAATGFYVDDVFSGDVVNAANPANSPDHYDDIVKYATITKVLQDARLQPK